MSDRRTEFNTQKGIKLRKKIMQAIIDYMMKHGYPPTLREIGEVVERGNPSMHRHIQLMLKEGVIETDSEYVLSPRAIRVPGYKYVKVDPVEVTPYYLGDGDEVIDCPSCGETYFAEDWEDFNFCPKCGQAIKVIEEMNHEEER